MFQNEQVKFGKKKSKSASPTKSNRYGVETNKKKTIEKRAYLIKFLLISMFSSQYQVFYKEAKWFEITIKSVLK